jgi:hypothetical protein
MKREGDREGPMGKKHGYRVVGPLVHAHPLAHTMTHGMWTHISTTLRKHTVGVSHIFTDGLHYEPLVKLIFTYNM